MRDGVRGGVHGGVRDDDGGRLVVRDGGHVGTKKRRASGVMETPEKKFKR